MKTNNLILKAALSVGGSIALFFGGLMLPMSIFGDMVEGASDGWDNNRVRIHHREYFLFCKAFYFK